MKYKDTSKLSSVVQNKGEIMKLNEIAGNSNICFAGCTVLISWPMVRCKLSYLSVKMELPTGCTLDPSCVVGYEDRCPSINSMINIQCQK